MPFCEHDKKTYFRKSYKYKCRICHSFYDVEQKNKTISYDCNYITVRSHFNKKIGTLKVNSLKIWLRSTRLDIENKVVCEVGFGGGFCLQYLKLLSKSAFGIEINEECRQHATKLGLRSDTVFDFRTLPEILPSKIDVWFFLDSFEHLEDPSGFVKWLIENSNDHAHLLIVAPCADSLSEKILKKFWPHRLPDHYFHWSSKGITSFFNRRGFRLEKSFFPWKKVSLDMIIRHLSINNSILGKYPTMLKLDNLDCKFNIGQMGLLFRMEKQ